MGRKIISSKRRPVVGWRAVSSHCGDVGGEILDREVGMRRGDDLQKPFEAERERGLDVARGGGLERGRLRPERIVGGQPLRAVERVEHLEIDRLLGPERAVIVEGRDALGFGDEAVGGRVGGLRDEVEDGRLWRRPRSRRAEDPAPGRRAAPEGR
jgi:hypothetical protein